MIKCIAMFNPVNSEITDKLGSTIKHLISEYKYPIRSTRVRISYNNSTHDMMERVYIYMKLQVQLLSSFHYFQQETFLVFYFKRYIITTMSLLIHLICFKNYLKCFFFSNLPKQFSLFVSQSTRFLIFFLRPPYIISFILHTYKNISYVSYYIF